MRKPDLPAAHTVMTSQQKADQLLRRWQDLWPMPAAERIKHIDEIDMNIRYDELLQIVEMVEPPEREINLWLIAPPLCLALAGAIETVVILARIR